jgi:hypothetical protein
MRMQLGDVVQQPVDPLAGLGTLQGGGEACAISVELVQVEEAGLEALFEGCQGGGGYGRDGGVGLGQCPCRRACVIPV